MDGWLRSLRGFFTRGQDEMKHSRDETERFPVEMVPKQSLLVRFQHERSKCWRMTSLHGEPAMNILADFYLTNMTREHQVFVTRTFFAFYHHKWWPFPRRVEGKVIVTNHFVAKGQSVTSGIPPGVTYEAQADWWIQPPVQNEGRNLTGKVCFVDQFENEHWTAVATWKYR
jgi:hypothetical protein